ncbi:MAG: hypothetical protein HYZ14_00855 [Bacteroidetes bacterium]|nr:hypothetical protein [Bacteroidota bacterium]
MRTLLTYSLCFFLPGIFAQQTNTWNLYSSVEGVEIYYQEVSCTTDQAPAQVAYILKVVNTTGSACRVSWDMEIWYNNEKLAHDVADGENHMTVDLEAKGQVAGTCDAPYGALYIFKDFITYVSPTKLTRFELENIRIAKI